MKRTLKPGLTGLIRAKNEGLFIEGCIESIINAIDELIVVYNDCTDNTESILQKLKLKYPDKLKIYPYNHNILSHNLSRQEFEYAKSLPDDSNRLHCNQCNYALLHASYTHAMKIDPDQIYFENRIKKWSEVCKGNFQRPSIIDTICGFAMTYYISLYRRISSFMHKPLYFMVSKRILQKFLEQYERFQYDRLFKGKAAISVSGVNLFWDNKWYIPFDKYNTHPPYNGECDTLLFKTSESTHFERLCINHTPYRIIERFKHPYKILLSPYPIWFHLHANRSYCAAKVRAVKDIHPQLFIEPEDFLKLSYKEVLNIFGKRKDRLYQRILFAIVHQLGNHTITQNIHLLSKIRTTNLA